MMLGKIIALIHCTDVSEKSPPADHVAPPNTMGCNLPLWLDQAGNHTMQARVMSSRMLSRNLDGRFI